MCCRYILDKIQTCSPSPFVTPLNSKKKKIVSSVFMAPLNQQEMLFDASNRKLHLNRGTCFLI